MTDSQRRELVFALPSKVWSTNQDRNMYPIERASLIKEWKWATKVHYVSQFKRAPQPPSIVQVVIPVADRRRRDPMNYCGTVVKAVIDGLVEGGAWPDDTPEYVSHMESILKVDTPVVVSWTPFTAWT